MKTDTKKARIKDVAEKAGVSPSTVTMVFKGSPSISRETAEKVLQYACMLGYEPRKEAPKRTDRKVALLSTKGKTMFASRIYIFFMHELELLSSKYHYSIQFQTFSNEDELPTGVDAVILMGDTVTPRQIEQLAGIPTVKIFGKINRALPWDTVTSDFDAREPIVLDYFKQENCDHVFFVLDKLQELFLDAGSDAYRTNIVDGFKICPEDPDVIDPKKVAATAQRIADTVEDKVVGIYCLDEQLMPRLFRKLQELLPEKFSLLRFVCLNYSMALAHDLVPTPKFLHICEKEIICNAVEQLHQRMENPNAPKKTILIEPYIV